MAASNDELRRANALANSAAVKALLSQGRSLASLIGDGVVNDFLAEERQSLDALPEMAAGLRREERARKTAAGAERVTLAYSRQLQRL